MRHPHHWEHIPEMVPELVVPDLEGFQLKPYVSYRTKEIYQVCVLSRAGHTQYGLHGTGCKIRLILSTVLQGCTKITFPG